MRTFILDGKYEYGEIPVKEIETGKSFTLTQRKQVFSEDFYSVYRFIAVENVPADVVPEPDFYVYRVSYMIPGPVLCIKYIDERTMLELYLYDVINFLRGCATESIKEFFERKVIL